MRMTAWVMTPSVPSEPMKSSLRLRDETFLIVFDPTWITLPSARTTSSARTQLIVTPWQTARNPPAFVAILPPTEHIEADAGSGAKKNPSFASSLLS